MDPSQVRVHSDEKLSPKASLFYGFQSLLACNLFLGPLVVIGVLRYDVAMAAAFIGMTFFACGIATIIQSGFFLKMQVIQGMSFACFGAIFAIVLGADFPTLIGALLVSSVFIILLGATGIFSKFVRIFIPGMIAGTVITVVGVSLMPVTFTSILNIEGNVGVNFFLAGLTLALLIIFMRMGAMPNKLGKFMGVGGIIYAIVIGTLVASFFGVVDLSPVAEAKWFAIPKVFPLGLPKFELNSILVFLVIMVISMIESVGTWFTITELSGDEVDDKRMNRGVMGEGIGVFVGSFFGGLPISSYASNTGVLVMTKVFSRYAAIAAGIIAIVLAFCPKLMFLIAIVPPQVVWGVYAMVTIQVLLSGINSVRKYPATERNNIVIGAAIFATIGTGLLPAALVNSMPGIVGYLFSAPIAIGCIVVVVMNLILPAKASDRTAQENELIKLRKERKAQKAAATE